MRDIVMVRTKTMCIILLALMLRITNYNVSWWRVSSTGQIMTIKHTQSVYDKAIYVRVLYIQLHENPRIDTTQSVAISYY